MHLVSGTFTEEQVLQNLAALNHDPEHGRVCGKSITNMQMTFYALTRALYTEEELQAMLVEYHLANPEEDDEEL